jgi:hypothetical protein
MIHWLHILRLANFREILPRLFSYYLFSEYFLLRPKSLKKTGAGLRLLRFVLYVHPIVAEAKPNIHVLTVRVCKRFLFGNRFKERGAGIMFGTSVERATNRMSALHIYHQKNLKETCYTLLNSQPHCYFLRLYLV